MQVERAQVGLEAQVETFQSALAKLQGENWQTHFTRQLISIKKQVSKMEQNLNAKKAKNTELTQQRDAAQKKVDDLSDKLRQSQSAYLGKDEEKQQRQQHQPMVCGGPM